MGTVPFKVEPEWGLSHSGGQTLLCYRRAYGPLSRAR